MRPQYPDRTLSPVQLDSSPDHIYCRQFHRHYIKGTVSRDGGRDKAMEWQIKPKLMVANPFFCFWPSQSYGPYSSASINVKPGSPDPTDFDMTWLIIHWRVLAIRTMVGVTVGILRPSICDMPMD
jgi:hypothetical protein